MQTADFDFQLPPELIAQVPAPERDQSRLLVLHRAGGKIEHRRFPDLLDYLRSDDVLVLNNSRVIRARLRGTNLLTRGEFEILLLEEIEPNEWWTLMRPARRGRIGTEIRLHDESDQPSEVRAVVVDVNEFGHRRLRFEVPAGRDRSLVDLGEVPLPRYIQRARRLTPAGAGPVCDDFARYQTVYARPPGSVAAPTAGLHFTEAILDRIRSRGIQVCFLTLHVGLATFAPVKTERIADHPMHEERFEVPEETALAVTDAARAGRRVVAVGTTTVRALESVAARNGGRLTPGPGRTRLFIHPPYDFKVVNVLLTNFHLPRSTLLMLVSAFAAPRETGGRGLVLAAYAEAIRERYRFFSYGDAMLLL
jgi:S-adenosylmethionine:tRNA ribosyltransferase-isomerase